MPRQTLWRLALITGLLLLAAMLLLVLRHQHATASLPAGQQMTETPSGLPRQSAATAGAPPIGGPFTLTSTVGPVSQKNLLGHFTLLYFGYTHCPDVCPTVLATLAQVYQQLPPAQQAKLQVVFVSVDPARDTPATLQAYVAGFNPHFVGWTGTPAELTQITHAYLTYYAKREDPQNPTEYSMDHSSILYLLSPDGQFVTNFGHTDPANVLLSKLAPLLAK